MSNVQVFGAVPAAWVWIQFDVGLVDFKRFPPWRQQTRNGGAVRSVSNPDYIKHITVQT